MAWFKVDDNFADHPKVMRIPPGKRGQAVGLWLLAGVWCAKHRTDGHVPTYMIKELGFTLAIVSHLVTVGLWEVSDGGWIFHEWKNHQPPRDELEKRDADNADRQRRFREKKAAERADLQSNGSHNAPVTRYEPVTNGISNALLKRGVTEALRSPDPTRPDPTVVPSELQLLVADKSAPTSKTRRGTRVPDAFEITEDMRQWAAQTTPGIDVDLATLAFHNHFSSKTTNATMLDWGKTWQNWLLKDFSNKPASSRRPQTRQYFGQPGERKSMF